MPEVGTFKVTIPFRAVLDCRRGMTLIEVILVLALGALMLVAAVISINAMRESSDTSRLNNDLQRIVYGISEYQMISKTIPSGSSWPASLNDFVEPALRSDYSYVCDATTGNVVTITSAGTYQSDPSQKLKDQNMCTSDSRTAYNANKTVTCVPVIFAGQSCS